MKKTLAILALVASLGVYSNAQTTNTVATPKLSLDSVPAETGKQAGQWELTLGGGGTSIDGENAIGLDFSLSTNPLKTRPEVWFGIAQGVYWEPSFSGSTDLFVDWSQAILPSKLNDSLYLNVGWSGGVLYDNQGTSPVWRTGPEVTVQFYTSDNAFVYGGVNYDVYQSDRNEGNWRYCFGIGISF